ncbi:MAG TPA: universal stress protein [Coleofasciculaceae cyanobacterium]
MNIKPMLVPVEGAIDRNDLIEQMVLLPEPASAASKWSSSTKSVNLVVGYNASPKSQTALDLTMWIAHQTRSVTQKQVTVQVVYVVDEQQNNNYVDECKSIDLCSPSINRLPLRFLKELASKKSATSGLTNPQPQRLAGTPKKRTAKRQQPKETLSRTEIFEQADRILWQARCLAEEWRGSFKAHLRFGDVATELKEVVESESATLLLLGCNCVNHPIVRQLASDSNLPCAVLGIPNGMSADIKL